MLAAALNARVVMPDFFAPSPAWDVAKHPPKTAEDKAAFQAFFGGPANPAVAVDKLARVARTLKEDGALRVGAYGLCWGKGSKYRLGNEAAYSQLLRRKGRHFGWREGRHSSRCDRHHTPCVIICLYVLAANSS